ncbi:gliding motility lipoprotein GldH [Flavobacterium wongokense]|uniref:gliding motility lipoprotein GldH n=1 Tax=Flavobacterium wongokense TaxID=2910674 RepID=UPI001F2E54B3|nr:gliding motility lipoprotein GldH [Flavobacterium sp. WG47]MCF6131245.1 gliding motility lipoprotein GldH [Flavobacterium sp. WG47]
MKTKFLLFIIFPLLFSCSENHFHQFDKLPEEQRWLSSDIKTYEFDIENEAQFYNIVFEFSHVYDYQFESIPLNVTIQSPDGKTEQIAIDLKIKDESGKQLADCSGDVCDLFYKIKERTKLQKGEYKITVSHSFKGPFLPNVIGVGLAVQNVK